MSVRIPPDCRKLRAASKPLTLFLLIVALPGLFCVVLILDGLRFDPFALIIASVFVLVISPLMALLMSHYYSASFSSEGIYGHSFWGLRRFVYWRDVVDVRRFRLLNLPWLRVYTTDSRVTWVALFQADKTEFRREIERLAPTGHPVLNHLR